MEHTVLEKQPSLLMTRTPPQLVSYTTVYIMSSVLFISSYKAITLLLCYSHCVTMDYRVCDREEWKFDYYVRKVVSQGPVM